MPEPYTTIRSAVLATLEQELPHLRKAYGIAEIGIFGSVSRGEDTPDVDVDILYTFQPGKTTIANLTGLYDHLVSRKWIRPILRPTIEQDAIHLPEDPWKTLNEFMTICTIIKKPGIQHGADQWKQT